MGYSAIVTFGGCQDDLMVVVNNCDIQGPGTQRMLFSLAKPKILELTLLIADYMNALGCVLPNTPNATLTRLDSRRSGRSKTKERDSDRATLNHRLQASAEPDILRATPEMKSKRLSLPYREEDFFPFPCPQLPSITFISRHLTISFFFLFLFFSLFCCYSHLLSQALPDLRLY